MIRLLFFATLLLLLLPGAALAASKTVAPPSSVLFYPDEAHLTVEATLAAEAVPGKGRGLVITLPPGAVTGTFSATVNNEAANGFFWLKDDGEKAVSAALEQNQERRALLAGVEELKVAVEQKQAAVRVAENRSKLLIKGMSGKEELTTENLLKLDAAFAERLPALYANLSKDKRELSELESRLDEANRVLAEFDAKNKLHTAVIPFYGQEGKTASVRYSYIIPASCNTLYRMTAYPATDKLAIEQDAILYQDSGQIWKNVDLYISTTRRDTALRPASIPPWLIKLVEKDRPTRDQAQYEAIAPPNMAQMPEVALGPDVDYRGASAVQEEKGTFRLWSLGRRTVDPGVAVTLPLSSEEYAAKYYYTVLPYLNAKGFLTAELNLDKALELPPGSTRFFVDNVAVGEQLMSLDGTKAVLFFGTDPQVTATMRDVKRSKGEQGIFSKEQNISWHWEIVARNGRNRPVEVRVLDPIPDAQDAAIKVTAESKPKPEEGRTPSQLGAAKAYVWNVSLKPGETQTIEHKVQVTAPAERHLYLGRPN